METNAYMVGHYWSMTWWQNHFGESSIEYDMVKHALPVGQHRMKRSKLTDCPRQRHQSICLAAARIFRRAKLYRIWSNIVKCFSSAPFSSDMLRRSTHILPKLCLIRGNVAKWFIAGILEIWSADAHIFWQSPERKQHFRPLATLVYGYALLAHTRSGKTVSNHSQDDVVFHSAQTRSYYGADTHKSGRVRFESYSRSWDRSSRECCTAHKCHGSRPYCISFQKTATLCWHLWQGLDSHKLVHINFFSVSSFSCVWLTLPCHLRRPSYIDKAPSSVRQRSERHAALLLQPAQQKWAHNCTRACTQTHTSTRTRARTHTACACMQIQSECGRSHLSDRIDHCMSAWMHTHKRRTNHPWKQIAWEHTKCMK